jgi:single-stranded DNA-binding protein
MIKMTATNAVVSKGFNGAEALRIFQSGDNKTVRFRIGVSVYDKNAENNRRYVNISVKAFNGMCSRIESMKLDAGMYVNITGRYDEESWEDQTTHEKKSAPVLILDDIEFCHNGSGKQNGGDAGNNAPASNGQGADTPPPGNNQQPDNFTGYEGFNGTNPYFPG